MFLKLMQLLLIAIPLLVGLFVMLYLFVIDDWLAARREAAERKEQREHDLEKLRLQRDIALLGEPLAHEINTTQKEKEGKSS